MFQFLDWAQQLGLEGVDLYSPHLDSLDEHYLQHVKDHCARLGLRIVCIAVEGSFGNPPAGRDAQMALTRQCIDVAQFLGAPFVEVIAGWAPEGETRNDTWTAVVGCLRDVCAYAQGKGVIVTLQNHNHSSLTQTGEDMLAMIRDVGCGIGHLLDTGQYAGSAGATGSTTETLSDAFYGCIERTAPLAQIVRAQTYYGGSRESGTKNWQVDYERVMRILKRSGFSGPICVRHWGLEPEETAIPKSVQLLRAHLNRWDEY